MKSKKQYVNNYNVKYTDQNKEPEDSGSYEKIYTLIRENNSGGWKIDEARQY
ncbi:DUF4829 domain-containing protein [Clostridium botulinum]|nr:DUF4829 domain-containing protein [Clostridium botulinum]